MRGASEPYVQRLASEADEEVDVNMTGAEASKRTDELQQKTGRGE